MAKEPVISLVTEQQKTPMDRVQLARHDKRPYALDYIERIFTSFRELHGDRCYRDDPAIVGGTAMLADQPVLVIAHQKGRHLKERQKRNFGMPKPDGYRKAIRLMEMAEKFGRPILCFVDTPGAFPGIDAEERGQAQAIAVNLKIMARITVPIIVTVTGEGGSGGALAIAVGDTVNMMENSIYSVITPEGCAAILWKDSTKSDLAAASMKLTALDLKALGLVDNILPEPGGGAHEDIDAMAATFKEVLMADLQRISSWSIHERLEKRYEKFRSMGRFIEH